MHKIKIFQYYYSDFITTYYYDLTTTTIYSNYNGYYLSIS